MTDAPEHAEAAPAPVRRPRRITRACGLGLGALLSLGLILFGVARFAPLTQTGRAVIVSHLNGLPLGALGRLQVSGLSGDIWSDFRVSHLAIADAGGPWLVARNLHVRWRPSRLLRRRIHAQLVQADQLILLRRPSLQASGPPSAPQKPPVSIFIDQLALQLETRPAFSVERGLFQIDMTLDIARKGGVAGAVQSRNLLHAGDGMEARFDLGVGRKVVLDAHAHESRGGALAGMLGLPVAQAVLIDAQAGGDLVEGHSQLSAFSGRIPIAQAGGVWTKAGGGLKGWISMTASTWTAPLLRALGPQLRFSFNHAQVHGAVRDVALKLDADNASLSLAGALDLNRHRTPDGLKLDLAIGDLSRIVAHPAMGAGRVDGLLKGADTDWDFTGRASAQRVAVADGYSLGQISGPVRLVWRAQELRLSAQVAGAGGQGGGLAAALGGARPQANLDASRLPDGRVLLRALKISGAGLKLDASGAVGLLGDLSFKGGAQMTNLGAAAPGMRGAVAAHWSAAQANARQPWRLSADLIGAGMGGGPPQLDRLFGAKPQLHFTGAYDKSGLTIAKAELTGATTHLAAKGAISSAGDLKLTVETSAAGPFDAGPLEIAGRLQASGQVTGTLTAPRADLSAEVERIDIPQLNLTAAHMALSLVRSPDGIDGKLAMTGQSAYGPAHARGDFRFGGGRLDLTGLDAAGGGVTVQGALGLVGWTPDTADLAIGVGPGAYVSQGRADARLHLAESSVGSLATINLVAANLLARGDSVLVQSASFNGQGPLTHLSYTAQAALQIGELPLQLKGGGVASRTPAGLALTLNGAGRARATDFHTLAPATLTFNGAERTAQLDLSVGGGRAQINAHQTAGGLNGTAELNGVDLGTLDENLAGRFDASLSLGGQGERLQGRLDAHLKGARSLDAPSKLALDGAVKAQLGPGALIIDAAVDGAASADHASVHAVLPVAASAAPFRFALERDQPLRGQYAVSGALQPIWDLFFGGARELGGQLVASGDLAGTLASPKLTGHGVLTQGMFEDSATGLKLRDLSAAADLNNEAIDVQRFAAKDAKAGQLSGEGRLSLLADGASTLTINVKDFQLLDNETAKATATGAITVVRDAQGKAKLSGALTIDRADIQAASTRTPPGVVTMEVIERNKPAGDASPGLQAPTAAGPSLQIDVRISAPRHIYVRGLGLDAELSLDARVVGDTSAPQLDGKARVVRGIYDFAGKRFDIDDNGVVDLASTPDKIRLDLSATLNDPTLTAIIAIKGTAAKPLITLTSTPVLPSDEVLSQVLFGESAAQLSPVQAAQLAAAVTTLATGGGFDVMGGLGKLARLDRVALGGTSATGVTVSGGKYIGNHVYLELTGGGRQGPSAQVEVKATRTLSVISQIGGDVGAKLSIRWRKDFGKPAAAGK